MRVHETFNFIIYEEVDIFTVIIMMSITRDYCLMYAFTADYYVRIENKYFV